MPISPREVLKVDEKVNHYIKRIDNLLVRDFRNGETVTFNFPEDELHRVIVEVAKKYRKVGWRAWTFRNATNFAINFSEA